MGAPKPPKGWYPDPTTGQQRYWDGIDWTDVVVTRVLSRDERADRLDAAIAELVEYGGRIESRTSCQAVILSGSEPNHVVHVILTVFTCGLWLPIWLIAASTQTVKRTTVSVDPHGNVSYAGPGVVRPAVSALEGRRNHEQTDVRARSSTNRKESARHRGAVAGRTRVSRRATYDLCRRESSRALRRRRISWRTPFGP
jgi:hypothetical protein